MQIQQMSLLSLSQLWQPEALLRVWEWAACLGVAGGNKAQRLVPLMRAFQALVAKGSMCSPLPLRAGPITNHLQGPPTAAHTAA